MLFNKYRPKEFKDVVGQSINVKILESQLEQKDFPHMLFIGSAGSGKTTCAKIYANKLNAEILEIDAATYNGVQDVKSIIQTAKLKPLLKDKKIVIFDEAHMLTKAAWASLLIVLEEHINHLSIIFCTTEYDKIPETILSRLRTLYFAPINNNDILLRLETIRKEEKLDIDKNTLITLSKSTNNLRQAINDLETFILTKEDIHKIIHRLPNDKLSEFINLDNLKDITLFINDIYSNGYDLHLFIESLIDYCVEHTLLDKLLLYIDTYKLIQNADRPKNLIIANIGASL